MTSERKLTIIPEKKQNQIVRENNSYVRFSLISEHCWVDYLLLMMMMKPASSSRWISKTMMVLS